MTPPEYAAIAAWAKTQDRSVASALRFLLLDGARVHEVLK